MFATAFTSIGGLVGGGEEDEYDALRRKERLRDDIRSSPTSTITLKDTINLPVSPTRSMIRRCSKSSLLDYDSDFDNDDDEDDFSSLDDGCTTDDETATTFNRDYGVLPTGVQYETTKVLMEGWMHKKGSGNDIFGSVRWKERFCRLILAKVKGISVQVPLLLVFWYDFSFSEPSTIITLWDSSTVCMAVDNVCNDNNDPDAWNYKCFNIIHCAPNNNNKENSSSYYSSTRTCSSNIRTFTCSNRDKWVYEINQALYNYEKERGAMREKEVVMSSMMMMNNYNHNNTTTTTSSMILPLRPISPPLPTKNSLWTGDQYVAYDDTKMKNKKITRSSSPPPISPRTSSMKKGSSTRRPSLPRHPSSDRLTKSCPDVLLGEKLIK